MSVKQPNVFLVIGKSFSGKDTLINKILKSPIAEKCNIERLTRYTTRKPREGEVDGDNYYFISDEEYQQRFENDSECVIASFKSEFGELHYVADLSNLEYDKNYILDGDPTMVESFKRILKDRLCIIYLIPPNWEILRRTNNRKDNIYYISKVHKEIYRRFMDDAKMFTVYSNEIVSKSNCIICVGRDFDFDCLLTLIEGCVKRNPQSSNAWINYGLLILSDRVHMFDTNYSPKKLKNTYEDIFKNRIRICNGRITIFSEDESYETKSTWFIIIYYNSEQSSNIL